MSQAGLVQTAVGGAAAWFAALGRWWSHPRRGAALRGLAGRWPVVTLAAAGLAAVGCGVGLEHGWNRLLAFPPMIWLGFVPSMIRQPLMAPASLFALSAAWRLRAVRKATELEDLRGDELWELAGVPLVLMLVGVVILTAGLPYAAPLVGEHPAVGWLAGPGGGSSPAAEGTPWLARAVEGIRELAVGVLLLAVLGAARSGVRALGSLISALMALWMTEWGLAFASSFVRPFVGWLPWIGSAGRTRWLMRAALYAGVAGFAWMRAHGAWESWRPVTTRPPPPPATPAPEPPPVPGPSPPDPPPLR